MSEYSAVRDSSGLPAAHWLSATTAITDQQVREHTQLKGDTLIPDSVLRSFQNLAAKMAADKRFREGVEQGVAELERGEFSRLGDVKKELGDS